MQGKARPEGLSAQAGLRERRSDQPNSDLHQRGLADLKAVTDRLSALWSTTDLFARVSIVFSNRLSRSLGRADVAQRRVTLAAYLRVPGAPLEEVLCHELAHIVAFERVGKTERVHGQTWQRLVAIAGFAPSRRLRFSSPQTLYRHRKHGRTYVHRCQVCGFTRVARRRVLAWRCADCVAAGLDGDLVVSEQAPRS